MGKTTLMQAIVYCLTGGLSEAIEKNKTERWDHKYFSQRLKLGRRLSTANVEVDIQLGNAKYSLRRGFLNSGLLAMRIEDLEWIDDPENAARQFLDAISLAGYPTADDFARLVNRLLYLPESRRSLAWDFDSQLRLMTLLNPSFTLRKDIQKQRSELTSIDTEFRHLRYGINRLKARLEELTPAREADAEDADAPVDNSPELDSESNLRQIVGELSDSSGERSKIEGKRNNVISKLTKISDEIAVLRTEIEQTEAALIAESLKNNEKESNLAVEKIATMGICPSCGTQQASLKAKALEFLHNHSCLLCGSENPVVGSEELESLRSQLDSKLFAQNLLQDEFEEFSNRLETIRSRESALQFKANELISRQSLLPLLERGHISGDQSAEELAQLLTSLEGDKTRLESQLIERREELASAYETFRQHSSEEVEKLGTLYQKYATQFLGIECFLREIEYKEQGVRLTTFVPEFNEIPRSTPESCSEAQRFFLDIAFRMSLIELATKNSGSRATFICETPETALDVSYIDNVVTMFEQFASDGHEILLTANIQEAGISEKLLKNYHKPERKNRVVNLLNFGQLSVVHDKHLTQLKKIIRRVFG